VKIAGAEQSYDEILSRPVEEVMTRQMVAAAEDEPISDVVIKMMDYDLRHMPVVDVDVPVGIVARHDLLALLARRCR
jgi:CBS domain-containing protein